MTRAPRRRSGGRALAIVAAILPDLRDGLSRTAAERICGAIRDALSIEAFAINGAEQIIASCGEGMEHHPPGERYRTRLIGRALAGGQTAVGRTARSIGCADPDCPLTGGVAVPVTIDGRIVAVLSGWRTQRRPLSRSTIDILEGLAGIFAARLHEAEKAR
jgi:two-component system sensor histidine kinase LytS